MLIRVMLCFLGKVEGVSRGIAVCTNIVTFYICSVRSLLCTFLGSSSKFIRQAELFYHLNNCLSFYGHFGARSMPQQLLAANKVIVYQSRDELSL